MNKILLLTLMAILALTASAYDFMVNGLAYKYLNGQSGSELQVTYTVYGSSSNYRGLTTANIPSSVTYNGTTYSVTSIGDYAFYGCSGLTSATIGNSVTSIGYCAFAYCSGLTSVSIPNSVTSIGDGAFYGCSGLASVTIPNLVTSIGATAFADCTGLTSVTIPNSVTEIGHRAFQGCSGLTSVTIGNLVASIGWGAFNGCSGLTSVTIPNSVTSIGKEAFSYCRGLAEIRSKIVDIGNVTLGSDVFYLVPTYSCTIKVPYGTAAAYRNANQWKSFSNINDAILIPSGTVGDLNCDNVVNGEDVNIMVGQIIRQTRYDDDDGAADLNGDGVVNGIDLHEMINIILGI